MLAGTRSSTACCSRPRRHPTSARSGRPAGGTASSAPISTWCGPRCRCPTGRRPTASSTMKRRPPSFTISTGPTGSPKPTRVLSEDWVSATSVTRMSCHSGACAAGRFGAIWPPSSIATGASTASNLDLLGFAKVQRIVFDEVDRNRAVGITYLPQPSGPSAAPIFVPLAAGGRIILAAGALMSPRLLLLSGVGPPHRQDEIFPDGFSAPFHVHNRAIGTTLFDHVATSLTYEYTGATPPFRGLLLRRLRRQRGGSDPVRRLRVRPVRSVRARVGHARVPEHPAGRAGEAAKRASPTWRSSSILSASEHRAARTPGVAPCRSTRCCSGPTPPRRCRSTATAS